MKANRSKALISSALGALLVLAGGVSQASADATPAPQLSPSTAPATSPSPSPSPGVSPVPSAMPIPSAAPAVPLPFVPPASWTKFPIAAFIHPIANWTASDASAFSINTFPVAAPVSLLAPIVKSQLQNLGTVESTPTSITVCGQPALRFIVKMNGTGYLMTQQVQAIDNVMYTSSYVRSSDSHPNADIVKLMQSFCGPDSVSSGPPPGWHDIASKIVGMWMKPIVPSKGQKSAPLGTLGSFPFQVITLLSYNVDPDSKRLVQSATASAFQGSRFKLLSTSKGSLCGNSATFMSGRAKLPSQPEIDMTMEVTQSASESLVLLYGHPTQSPISKEALASLKTLCAR